MKWQVHEMTSWWNGKLMKLEFDKKSFNWFSGMEDDFEIAPTKKLAKKSKKMPTMNPKLKKAQKMAMSSVDLFASAEEFSALIDENEQDELAGGMEQVWKIYIS